MPCSGFSKPLYDNPKVQVKAHAEDIPYIVREKREFKLGKDKLIARIYSGSTKATTPNFEEAVELIGRLCPYDVEKIICYHGGVISVEAQQALKNLYENLKSSS